MSAALPILVAAAGGGALALALREVVRSMPLLAAYLESAWLALARAGGEGTLPSDRERRRLGVVTGVALVALITLTVGVGPAAVLAGLGPALAGWAVGSRHRRYRARIEADIAAIATSLADGLSAGGSLRNALIDAASTLEGPAAVELARVRADLQVGLSPREALGAFERRIGGEPVAALVAAVLSQQRAGGDLAELLRRHAEAATERRRARAAARAATVQARMTGGMVVAMPVGAALLVELAVPGFIDSMLSDPAAAILLLVALALQLGGYLLIRRLGRV